MEAQKSLIFVYGTLKQGHANHFLLEDVIRRNDAVFVGHRTTRLPYPLVVGLYGIPYLINLPGSGQRVRGELYAVSNRGLGRLDELEGTRVGHYERLKIEVESEKELDGVVSVKNGEERSDVVAVEAYLAHRSFGERLWEKKGKRGMREYVKNDGVLYVRSRDRPRGGSVLVDIEAFVSSRT